ncbi:MAG: hypothetical protein HQ582_28135, partial [Planctomycetes bacterium]|nr:hypothetical protein [Planctomycetota bacterium]
MIRNATSNEAGDLRVPGAPAPDASTGGSSTPTETGLPSVLLAGKLTALDFPGGGEVQMLALCRALASAGVGARLWRPWEDRLEGVGCLHLFGSLPEHLPVVEAAHRHGVPVVLSTIAWFDLASYWRQPRPALRRAAACAGFLARAG